MRDITLKQRDISTPIPEQNGVLDPVRTSVLKFYADIVQYLQIHLVICTTNYELVNNWG
jgi:hypothetical protein